MVQLRLMQTEDCQVIVGWNAEKDLAYLQQWAGKQVYQYPLTEEQIKARCNVPSSQILMAFDGKEAVGSVELDHIDLRLKTAHICRFLLPDQAQGRGLGSQILKELIRMSFEEMGLERLTLRVYCFNIKAIRCYEKCGFLVSEFHQDKNPYWNGFTMELRKGKQ